jgi:hypothetical protein
MDCAQMRQWVLGGGEVTSPEAARHTAECPACRVLFADQGDLPHLLGDLAAARPPLRLPDFDALQADLARAPTLRERLASLSSVRRWLVAGALLLFPVVLGALRHRHNLAAYPPGRLVIEMGLFAAATLASSWLWLRPLYKRQPGHLLLLAVLGLGLALPWLLAAMPATLAESGQTLPGGPSQLRRALSCFGYGSMTAAPVLIVVAGLGRRSSGYPGFSILPAVAGALVGILGLELHCPEVSPAHLLAGHAPIVLALPVLLLLVGFLTRRRTPGQAGQAPRR